MPLVNPPVIIQNNGTVQGAVNTENFIGGLSASVTGNVATITITGLPVGSIAPGTPGQILQTNAGTSTVWVTMSGDVTISSAGVTTVNSISGSSPIAITPANLQWVTGTVSPILSQADKTTGSGTGTNLTIQAQNETGATSTGGNLLLKSGSGTSTAGQILLGTGNTVRTVVDPAGIQIGTATDFAGGVGNMFGISPSTTAPTALPSTGIMMNCSLAGQNLKFNLNNMLWDKWIGNIAIAFDDNITNSATGSNITLRAQNATGTTTIGGNANISSGSGTSSNGLITLQIGSSTVLSVTDTALNFNSALTTPIIRQNSDNTASAVGQPLKLAAQTETGTTSTGGALQLTSGGGTSAAGNVLLQTGSTTRLTISPTNITVAAFGTAGVVHNDSSGNLSSSLIVNADVGTSAAIAVSKLAAGSSAQVLLNNATPTPTWTTISGDATISATGVLSTTYNFVDTFLFMGS